MLEVITLTIMLDNYERYLQLNVCNHAASCGHISDSDWLASTTLQHPQSCLCHLWVLLQMKLSQAKSIGKPTNGNNVTVDVVTMWDSPNDGNWNCWNCCHKSLHSHNVNFMTMSLSNRVPGPNYHWQVRTTCRSVLVVQYLLWFYSVCIMDLKKKC